MSIANVSEHVQIYNKQTIFIHSSNQKDKKLLCITDFNFIHNTFYDQVAVLFINVCLIQMMTINEMITSQNMKWELLKIFLPACRLCKVADLWRNCSKRDLVFTGPESALLKSQCSLVRVQLHKFQFSSRKSHREKSRKNVSNST